MYIHHLHIRRIVIFCFAKWEFEGLIPSYSIGWNEWFVHFRQKKIADIHKYIIDLESNKPYIKSFNLAIRGRHIYIGVSGVAFPLNYIDKDFIMYIVKNF